MGKVYLNYSQLSEVPEDLQQFCTVEGEGDEARIAYDATGLVTALQKERMTAKQIQQQQEKLQAQLEEMNKQKEVKPVEKPEGQTKESVMLEELRKSQQELVAKFESEQRRNQELERANFLRSIANESGLQDKAVDIVSKEIDKDERGFFVRDADGTAKVNPMTGERIQPMEYIKSLRTTDAWMFKNQPSSPGGFPGQAPKSKTNKEILLKSAKEAMEKGDTLTQLRLIRQANQI